ncbi:MAG: hypothetical protein ABTQ34_07905 [Bdellovibrionales bacterium]
MSESRTSKAIKYGSLAATALIIFGNAAYHNLDLLSPKSNPKELPVKAAPQRPTMPALANSIANNLRKPQSN